MVLSSLFPVFVLLLLGRIMKRRGWTDDAFLATSDRLIYFFFFPVLLFWKIGAARSGALLDWKLCGGVLLSLTAVYLISAVCIRLFRIPAFKAGSFSQSTYRFNTYIGMAVVYSALGDEGVQRFGVLIGFLIPLINVAAVATLIWYAGRRPAFLQQVKATLGAIVTNPLIVACAAGVFYARTMPGFPPFLENAFRLTASVTLPLALLSIGGALSFQRLKGNLRLALLSSVIKLALLPVIGYVVLHQLQVTGLSFKVGMLYFCLPTSSAMYVLSARLNSDTALASATIVLSTVLSFFSLSAALLL